MNEIIGNLSTLLKIIVMTIFPAITMYMSEDALLAVIAAIIGLIVSIIDARYPNTLLNNDEVIEE